MSGPAPAPPVRRGWRRIRLILAINGLGLSLAVLGAELFVRARAEGGLGGALRSVFGSVRIAAEGESDWLEPHPVLGYRLNTAHEPVSSLGIRHGELAPERPPGSLRVVVLGDSVSWELDGWVGALAAELRRGPQEVEVVNAAIPGYTTHQERLLFESGLDDARPDLVVLQYCLNDNHEFLHELTDGRWLVRRDAKQVLVPQDGGLVSWLSRHSYLVFELRKQAYLTREKESGFYPWDANPDFAPAWQPESWARQREELAALRDSVRAAGARLAVVVVPYEPQLARKYLERDRAYTLAPQHDLALCCDELGVPLLDVHPDFLAARDERLYKPGDPVHLTPRGHRLLADLVLAFLRREGLLP